MTDVDAPDAGTTGSGTTSLVSSPRSAVELIVSQVTLGFGGPEPVLHEIDLRVDPGRVMSLLGPSGCGKTTLLRCIAGLEVPSAGAVVVGDRRLTADGVLVAPDKRGVGMVFQDWALFPHMSVAENVGFGLPRGQRRDSARISETLELVGLEGLGSRRPDTLSGGQQQRVALGRALARRPGVLLLDEPFSNLDANLRSRVRTDVHRLLSEVGVTTVLVTHDRDEAFVLGDTVAVMRDGTILQVGPPAEVYGDPVDPWVAGFVGEAVVLDGRASDGVAMTDLGALAVPGTRSGDVAVVVRPEQLLLESASGVPGVVDLVEFSGPATTYEVVLGDLRLRVSEPGPPRHRRGDEVGVGVRPLAPSATLPAFARAR